ncbi:MAG: acyl-CoA dehydrogenase family protein [Myxococcales bacterium]|nr:acyl-CoA dehydrogenase family protein [Myxococcales bacterium]
MDFEAVDFWGLDAELSEEEIQIRNAVRAMVDREVLPIIGKCFEEGHFPMHVIPVVAEMGLLGANLHGYGCPGIGEVAYGLVMQELERGDSGIRSFVSVQGSLAMYPIYTFGSDEQRQKWLPGMAKGEIIGCFGLTEPDFGSNPAGMRTYAVKASDRWVITGNKMWITNGNIAQVAVIWAGTEDGFRGFIVPTDTPGFRARLVEHKFSLRASVTSELILDNVEVPLDAVLPGVVGLKGALACLSAARYGISWGVVGSAMAVYDEALRYAKERVQFSKPIAGYQLVQEKLVEMLTEISKAQLVNLRMGRMKERGLLRPHHISFAKRNNVAMARRTAQLGREILGANGIMYDYQVGRHLCNIETVYTYEGTHDIHTLVLGKEITKIAAFE